MTREEFAASVWTRIVARYVETPDLQPLCLELQDQFDADIPLALFLWAADDAGLSPDPEALGMLEAGIADWRGHVVRELRAVRRWLKPRVADDAQAEFREKLKTLELEAERLELDQLCRQFLSLPPGGGTAGAAAPRYLARLGVDAARVAAFCAP
ncbi:TIGR02444 family protein [Pseudodonghicola flavimaris]|uniref:TIGR02444 family protein n=1 Tax=Pseudodonghicola flavimaris TaxID=3050036 RepID=A0ABT7F2C7_9RHOB|nr:TIGR02444 family protein [Pseudodonghicola flavimaris]MDK3018761.1 TIGR02444 family protein [Pseudodonghicola flavimaris]